MFNNQFDLQSSLLFLLQSKQKYQNCLMKLRQIIIHDHPPKRRVLTQDNSASTSARDNFFQSSDSSPKQQKLPRIFRGHRYNFGSSLDQIGQQQSKKQRRKFRANKQLRSVTCSYHDKLAIQKAQKIFQSLCKPTTTPNSIIVVDRQSIKLAKPHSEVYQKIHQNYEQIRKNKKAKNVESILQFINTLKTMNQFFTKIDDILSLVLFKKGKVHVIKQNQIIYNQNDFLDNFYIVLWGELKLKQIYRNKIKYCIPGDLLCEQIVSNSSKRQKQLFGNIKIVKGSLIAQETVKSLTKCGLLSVKKHDYQQIKIKFAQNGEKDKINTFQRLFAWSLSKKIKFRK